MRRSGESLDCPPRADLEGLRGIPKGCAQRVRDARFVFSTIEGDSDRIRTWLHPISMRGGFGGEPTAEGGREHPPRFAEQLVRRVTRCASCVKLTCEFTIFDRPPPTTTDLLTPATAHTRYARTHVARKITPALRYRYVCVHGAHTRAGRETPPASRVCASVPVRARV